MAGKSTYIRQVALITLMAQIGSFVPAASAEIGLVDRIFTRVGASDDLSRGQSTFMVEMNETAIILNNATDRSLVILDEIGRGTTTFDGLSIAWARRRAPPRPDRRRTLFATHYHELTDLSPQPRTACRTTTSPCASGTTRSSSCARSSPAPPTRATASRSPASPACPHEIIDRAKDILDHLETNNTAQPKKGSTKGHTALQEEPEDKKSAAKKKPAPPAAEGGDDMPESQSPQLLLFE